MKRFWGYMSIIIATIFFGVSAPLNKIMVNEINPIFLGAMSYLIAGGFLFLVSQSPLRESILNVLDKKNDAETFMGPGDYLLLGITALSSSTIAPILYLRGLMETTAVNSALLLNIEVFFIIIMGLMILGESLKLKDLFGVFLLFTGAVLIVTQGNLQGISLDQNMEGNLLVITAAFFWSIDTVLSKFLSKKRDLISLSALKGFLGGLTLILIVFIFNMNLEFPISMVPLLLFVSIFSIGCSFILIYYSLREIGSTRVGSLFPLSSLFGAFFAFIILKEPLGPSHIISAILMILGIYILYSEGGS